MANKNYEGSLKLAILLTTVFFAIEIAGGFLSGSLSLLGDAGHMLRDVFALIISLSALNISKNLPSKRRTFGFHRMAILAAILISITGQTIFDPLLAALISVVIILSATKIVRESIMILLEFVPKDVDFDHVVRTFTK